MKKTNQLLKCIKPVLAITTALLTCACDSSGELDTSDDFDIVLEERGIDYDVVAANPSTVAQLPKFFIAGDTIVHGNISTLDSRGATQLDAGYINSAGQLNVQNVTLTWSRYESNPTRGYYTLSENNAWPVLDETKLSFFEEQMDEVIAAAEGSGNSINQALNNFEDAATAQVMVDAAASVGHITALGPGGWYIPGALQPYVLIGRQIEYTVTSTNQDLIDRSVISGTYTYTDRWCEMNLLSREVDGEDHTDFDQVTLDNSDYNNGLDQNGDRAPAFTLYDDYDNASGSFTITIQN